MKKVDKYIKEKMKKNSKYAERCDLVKEKAKVVKKIIEYRNKHGLTQTEFAHKVGVTQQYISKIEEGDFSRLDTIEHLLHAIGYKLVFKIERLSESLAA